MCFPALMAAVPAAIGAAGAGATATAGAAAAGALATGLPAAMAGAGSGIFAGTATAAGAAVAKAAAAITAAMPAISTIGSVASGVYSFMESREQAAAQEEMANYRVAIQQQNARRAESAAKDAEARGAEARRMEALRGRLVLGQMQAQLAASGQRVNEGSAAQLRFDQQGINDLNVQIVGSNFAREAEEFRIQRDQFREQGRLIGMAGRNEAAGIRTKGFQSAIGSATNVADKWFKFKQEGL